MVEYGHRICAETLSDLGLSVRVDFGDLLFLSDDTNRLALIGHVFQVPHRGWRAKILARIKEIRRG